MNTVLKAPVAEGGPGGRGYDLVFREGRREDGEEGRMRARAGTVPAERSDGRGARARIE